MAARERGAINRLGVRDRESFLGSQIHLLHDRIVGAFRPMEFWNIGTGRQGDAQFVYMRGS